MHVEQFFNQYGRTSFPYYPKTFSGYNPATGKHETFTVESGQQIEFYKAMAADGFRNITYL